MVAPSFADELAGKLALGLGPDAFRRRVRFAHMRPEVSAILRYTVTARLEPAPAEE